MRLSVEASFLGHTWTHKHAMVLDMPAAACCSTESWLGCAQILHTLVRAEKLVKQHSLPKDCSLNYPSSPRFERAAWLGARSDTDNVRDFWSPFLRIPVEYY